MKDRLSKFIGEEQLTPGKLAEIVGVQPSSISHLLSGRNKPGFDFISNLLRRFPHLNPYWLILGIEPMYNSDAEHTFVNKKQNDAESSNYKELFTVSANSNINIAAGDLPQLNRIQADQTKQSPPVNSVKSHETTINNSEPKQSTIVNPTDGNHIERVIVFMSDGTFTSYCPK